VCLSEPVPAKQFHIITLPAPSPLYKRLPSESNTRQLMWLFQAVGEKG